VPEVLHQAGGETVTYPTTFTSHSTADAPTFTGVTYRRITGKCNRCNEPARNFVEIYDPRTKALTTHYLCDSCQAKLCATVALFVRGDY
jgi:hypothetical protein